MLDDGVGWVCDAGGADGSVVCVQRDGVLRTWRTIWRPREGQMDSGGTAMRGGTVLERFVGRGARSVPTGVP